MSIDRIGKGPGGQIGAALPGEAGVQGSAIDRTTRTGATFEVDEAKATSATQASSELSPADKVRSGELSLDRYLDRWPEAIWVVEGGDGRAADGPGAPVTGEGVRDP